LIDSGKILKKFFSDFRASLRPEVNISEKFAATLGHASVAYNSIGKHLARIKLNTTSSEANLPTLLHKTLNALKGTTWRCQNYF